MNAEDQEKLESDKAKAMQSLKNHIEAIIGDYCDGTWNGLEGANFIEWTKDGRSLPQECANRIVNFIMNLMVGVFERVDPPEGLTDMQRFIELYKSVGITLKPEPAPADRGAFMLSLSAPDNKVIGYTAFVTEIYFDKGGNFINQGIWE